VERPPEAIRQRLPKRVHDRCSDWRHDRPASASGKSALSGASKNGRYIRVSGVRLIHRPEKALIAAQMAKGEAAAAASTREAT
jgi:RNase P/RNase MRP subunit p29